MLCGASGDHVTEAVYNTGGRQGLAIQTADSLGNRDKKALALCPGVFNIGKHFLLVNQNLGKVRQNLTVGSTGSQCRGCRNPSGIAAHQLQHNHMDGKTGSIQCKLTGGFRCIPSGTAKTGAMIRDIKIIVHGLGNTDYLHIQPFCLGELADLVAGVHGIVAAVIEEAADIELLQRLNHRGIVSIRQLAAAGTNRRGRRMRQLCNGGSRDIRQINEIPFQNSFGAKPGSVDLIYFPALPGAFHDSLKGGVDHGSGTSAMRYQYIYTHC